jgi:hypothetical protein
MTIAIIAPAPRSPAIIEIGIETLAKSLFALSVASWLLEIPSSVIIVKWSYIAIYLIIAYLVWTANNPISLKGSVLFLFNVKLKSKPTLPLGKTIPPNI